MCSHCGIRDARPNVKTCEICAAKQDESRVRLREKRLAAGLCSICGAARSTVLLDCLTCVEKRKFRYNALKLATFDAYGGPTCVLCGYSNILALSIDHIKGGGHQHMKDIGGASRFYRWLRDNLYPTGFRVLCMNCQFISKMNSSDFTTQV